jgi:hypothetical protein
VYFTAVDLDFCCQGTYDHIRPDNFWILVFFSEICIIKKIKSRHYHVLTLDKGAQGVVNLDATCVLLTCCHRWARDQQSG